MIQVGWCLPNRTPGYGMASVPVVGEHGALNVVQGTSGITAVGADGLVDTDVVYAFEIHGKLAGVLVREVDHFIAVAAGKALPLCTAREGAEAVRASIALEQSAARHRI